MARLTQQQKRVVFLSSIGGLLEFYDFTVYGLFAVYFSTQFFPSTNLFISIIESYSIFALGYIVRPIGGIIFSHIGDEIGRKTVMVLTMILMGIASIGLGLLPTYAQIGIMAPILMLLFRLLQGLAIGGELPSIIVYVTESVSMSPGFAMGAVFSGTVAGLLPGMLISLLLTHVLTTGQINNFGWRIPFIMGGLLCVIAYQIRKRLYETQAFTHVSYRSKLPFVELINDHIGKVIIGVGLVSIMATPIVLVLIFMPTYLIKMGKLDSQAVNGAIIIATCISLISTYVIGILADQFNIIKLTMVTTLLLAIAGGGCYYMLANSYNLILALSIFAVAQGAVVSLPPVLLSYLFPTHIRLSGVALSYNISFVLFGGLTPIIVSGLIEKTGYVYFAPLLWLIVAILATLMALFKCRRYLKLKNL
ncbi:MAG: MFS transporter [Burkholderiales bacterium]|nr:MFS transporter [Burkholderiales bacterium]